MMRDALMRMMTFSEKTCVYVFVSTRTVRYFSSGNHVFMCVHRAVKTLVRDALDEDDDILTQTTRLGNEYGSSSSSPSSSSPESSDGENDFEVTFFLALVALGYCSFFLILYVGIE